MIFILCNIVGSQQIKGPGGILPAYPPLSVGLSATGKLDAANYSYSRAVCLVKQVSASHHSGKEYRDGQLDIPDLCMTKKIYNRKNAPKRDTCSAWSRRR